MTQKKRRMYQATDEFKELLEKLVRDQYNYLGILDFDELNAVTVKDLTTKQYDTFLDFNDEHYRNIIEDALQYALQFIDGESIPDILYGFLPDEYLGLVLDNYNIITGYLYKPEAERKRLRQAEEMLTAATYLDYTYYAKALRRCANLWFSQSMQYAICLEDTVCIETWKKAGVKKVIWYAEEDDRTCATCMGRDGKVYPIDEIPYKTHTNCRCWVEPYTGKN